MTDTIRTSTAGHPLVEFAVRVHGVLDRLADTPAWSMTAPEQRHVLIDLARAQARIEEVRLRVLAAGDRADATHTATTTGTTGITGIDTSTGTTGGAGVAGVVGECGATSTAAWLAQHTRVPVSVAHRDVKLATTLDTCLGETRAALAAGAVDTEHARVIAETVTGLPTAVVTAEPDLVGRVEKHLLALAGEHDARTLKRLARHVLDVIDPDTADEALGRRLRTEEAAAARATSLQLFDNGDGTHTGRFKISTLHAAMLTTALEAFTNPTHHQTNTSTHTDSTSTDPGSSTAAGTGTGTGESPHGTPRPRRPRRPRPELLGAAFSELLERLDPTRLPTSGGVNATVVVLLDYDQLLTGLGTAHLNTGTPISASLARRLACDAEIIPAVIRRLIDGRSVVLDLGRTRRLHTEPQRIALTIEQGGCTTDGCTRPAAWCHAHHDTPWSHGGHTSLTNGRLLCPHHHTKAHDPTYDTTHLPHGKITFTRRT
ncbi:MAG: DUF222 domain-containing protein [Nocardioidaceae bacterium]